MLNVLHGRVLEVGQVVEVYYNLHKKCYSLKDRKTGLVVAHADCVTLAGAKFVVSEAGRQRVLREKKKNVHARIVGAFVSAEPMDVTAMQPAYYNPYTVATFVNRNTMSPLHAADSVHCANKQSWYN